MSYWDENDITGLWMWKIHPDTDTRLSIYDGELQGMDVSDGNWQLKCEAHRTILSFEHVEDAVEAMEDPRSWCAECAKLLQGGAGPAGMYEGDVYRVIAKLDDGRIVQVGVSGTYHETLHHWLALQQQGTSIIGLQGTHERVSWFGVRHSDDPRYQIGESAATVE